MACREGSGEIRGCHQANRAKRAGAASRVGPFKAMVNPQGVAQERGEESRRRILSFIQGHPGTNKSQAARELGESWGNLSHHVDRLNRAGVIRERKVGRQVLLFPSNHDARRSVILAALRDPLQETALKAVRELAPASIQDVANRTGQSRKVTRRCLATLERVGLIDRDEQGWGRFFVRGRTDPRDLGERLDSHSRD